MTFFILGHNFFTARVFFIKNNNVPGHKTLSKKKFDAWIIIIKTFDVINIIPVQALATNLISHLSTSFSLPQLHGVLTEISHLFKAKILVYT